MMEKIKKGDILSSLSAELPFAVLPVYNNNRYCSYSNCRHCFDIDIFNNNNNNNDKDNNNKYSCKCGFTYCNSNCYKFDNDINHHIMICKSNNDSHINEFIKWTEKMGNNSSLYLFASHLIIWATNSIMRSTV